MTIEFCAINKPEDWMEMVAKQFGTSVTDNGFAVIVKALQHIQ